MNFSKFHCVVQTMAACLCSSSYRVCQIESSYQRSTAAPVPAPGLVGDVGHPGVLIHLVMDHCLSGGEAWPNRVLGQAAGKKRCRPREDAIQH